MYSKCGCKLALAIDKVVNVCDTETGFVESTLTGHNREVMSVCFSPDGKQIASGSEDKTVKIWNASTGELQSTLAGHTGYVPAFPCSACSQSRGVCSLSSDEQVGLLRRV